MYSTRSEEGGSGISHIEDPSPGTDLIRDITQRSAGGAHHTSSLNAGLGYSGNVGQEEETHSENVGSDADELPFEASLLGWMKRSVCPSHGWYPGLISKIHLVILLLIGHAFGTSLGKDCVFLKLQWMFSMPVKNINGKIQIMIMFLLILGANGKDYDEKKMKINVIFDNEVHPITDNVTSPHNGSIWYINTNMGDTESECSKEYAEVMATCKLQPYTSSCQGFQTVRNGSTWYLALSESKMPDGNVLCYCVFQAVPGELALYQGCIFRKPVDGGWGEWTNWSNYSAISGGESRFRNRSCSDPTPKYGGSNCSGKSSEEQIRMIQDCPNPWKRRFIIVLVLLVLFLFALIVIGIKYYLWQKEKGNKKESAKESVKYRRSRGDDDDSAVEV